MSKALDYVESCRRLHALGLLDSPVAPPIPDHRPQSDDEEPLGVEFFRTGVEGDLSGLTLPRTFFGRCDVKNVSFRGTDLHESTLCWNDFTDVIFEAAVLSDCDLRASNFERVSFKGADLRRADLRRSDFVNCVFDGASTAGMLLTRKQGRALRLSLVQCLVIDWRNDDGEEPDGG